jgi:hypothetical protein
MASLSVASDASTGVVAVAGAPSANPARSSIRTPTAVVGTSAPTHDPGMGGSASQSVAAPPALDLEAFRLEDDEGYDSRLHASIPSLLPTMRAHSDRDRSGGFESFASAAANGGDEDAATSAATAWARVRQLEDELAARDRIIENQRVELDRLRAELRARGEG